MSVGSWLLAGVGRHATALATAHAGARACCRAPAPRRALGAGVSGLPIATYTAVAARRHGRARPGTRRASELPFVFAGERGGSAGAAAAIATPVARGRARAAAGRARRRRLAGGRGAAMERRLGPLARALPRAATRGRYRRLARGLTAGRRRLVRRSRRAAAARPRSPAALAVLGGAAAERWSVFKAGFAFRPRSRQTRSRPQRGPAGSARDDA